MNRNWMKKVVITFVVLLLVIVFMVVGYRFYESTFRVMVTDDFSASNSDNFIQANSSNYTNIFWHCQYMSAKKIKS